MRGTWHCLSGRTPGCPKPWPVRFLHFFFLDCYFKVNVHVTGSTHTWYMYEVVIHTMLSDSPFLVAALYLCKPMTPGLTGLPEAGSTPRHWCFREGGCPKPFLATPLHPWPASLRQRTVHVQPGMQWDFWVGLSSGVWGAVHAPNALPSSTHRHTCLLRSPGFDPHLLPSEMSPFPQNGCWE